MSDRRRNPKNRIPEQPVPQELRVAYMGLSETERLAHLDRLAARYDAEAEALLMPRTVEDPQPRSMEALMLHGESVALQLRILRAQQGSYVGERTTLHTLADRVQQLDAAIRTALASGA